MKKWVEFKSLQEHADALEDEKVGVVTGKEMHNIGKNVTPVVITSQMAGALLNGTRVEKILSKPDDGVADGEKGTVLGSVGPIRPDQATESGHPEWAGEYGYFVRWDRFPTIPVFIAGMRVRELLD
jgi:hypothetical protein